nr:hypothetical protein [uncultured Methanoregula sp.]
MDFDFLKEYTLKEVESLEQNKCVSDRIETIRRPLFFVDSNCSLWSQIAFSGSVVFPVSPSTQENFENLWHISPKQMPDFIQFAKETKKIQFVLTDFPMAFSKCDYLEPILQEFSPPVYSAHKEDLGEKYKDLRASCSDEIHFLAEISPEWKYFMAICSGRSLLEKTITSYTTLRHMGFNEMADIFIENFLSDPKFSLDYIETANKFLINPSVNPLQANLTLSIKTIHDANNLGIGNRLLPNIISFPEVGSFLMNKCTHYPESLESCKKLIDRYEDNDLYTVYSDLNNAIIDRTDMTIMQKRNEMGEILDNVWEDTTLKSNVATYHMGIKATCGIVGYSLGGALGLLASLGLECLDKSNSNYIEQFSELIAKKVAQPYMATIYDFKKKYRIDS